MKRPLSWVALGVACILLLSIQVPLPPRIGQIDFAAYWSTSYLLVRGQNFNDPAQLFRVEKELTTWPGDFPMQTWNPPWTFSLLIPYTLTSFGRAVWWWLLTNITLVFSSAVILWRINAKKEQTRRLAWLAPLIAFVYAPTLTALIAGQVNLIVLGGLTGFLFFEERKNHARAGIALALTTIKIHLVYVMLPLVLLYWLRGRNWRPLISFGSTLFVLTAIVFCLRPTFILEYGFSVGNGRLLDYEVPTLGMALSILTGWNGFKLIGLVVLPLIIALWWRIRIKSDIRPWIGVTLFVSILTAPFGWSYDFVILVVPLMSIAVWVAESEFERAEIMLMGIVFLGANVLIFYERILTPSEFYFFWFPLVMAALYGYAWIRQRKMSYA